MAKSFLTREAGAVLNKRNKNAVGVALALLKTVLIGAGVTDDDEATIDDKQTNADEDDDKDDKTAKAKKTDAKQAKTAEAHANRRAIEAAGFSVADLATLLQNALNQTRTPSREGEYVPPLRIVDIYDDYFVYCVGWSGTEYYRIDFTVTESGDVTLGVPVYVNRKVTYITPAVSEIAANEAGDVVIAEDCVRLVERAIGNDGKVQIRLIKPGLGTSGLYTADVLRRDGPRAFPKGTKMFWDHDTAQEARDRPEGTLTRLAAVLDEDARWIDDHKDGAGLYAQVTVKEKFRADLNDLAADIGTSISADGRMRMGEYNGARVPIITEIKPHTGINNRVDFVTVAGAGGKVVALFESARNRSIDTVTEERDHEMSLTAEDVKAIVSQALKEANAPLAQQVARLTEAATIREAATYADRVLSGPKYATLPPATRQRIATNVSTGARLAEAGGLDTGALDAAIEAAAKDEAAYLSSATGRAIAIGLGESRALDGDTTAGAGDDDSFEDYLAGRFTTWGLSEAAAKAAAAGR